MKCTQQSQLTSFPKVRVLKKWFRHFNDHREFRNDGTLHLFSLMALYSYANFRSNTKTVNGWHMVNAGKESNSYITRACLLQGRNSLTEEWQTLDLLDGNKADDVERSFEPASVRYIRLFVTGPTQEINDDTVRIYELEVYGE